MGGPPAKSGGSVVHLPNLRAQALRGSRRLPMPNPTLTPTRPTEQSDDSTIKRLRLSAENHHDHHTSTYRGHQRRPTYMYFQNYTGRQKTFTSGPQRHVYATQSRIVPTRVGRDLPPLVPARTMRGSFGGLPDTGYPLGMLLHHPPRPELHARHARHRPR